MSVTGAAAEGVTCVHVTACPAALGCGHAPGLGEVWVWLVDLTRPPVSADELFARLTEEEQARARRYKIAKAREQFAIGRGLLRGLLGEVLGVPPATVPLAYLPSKKPILCGESPALHFNVTHTDGVAVIALARRRVGVDVERVRAIENRDGLVERYFSRAEAIAYRALPERHRHAGFFRGWTTKEAVIKAAGATVGCLADFDVELHPEQPPRVNAVRDPQLSGTGWQLAEWVEMGDAAVAIAVEGRGELRVEKSEGKS